jgi:hypothetical protein
MLEVKTTISELYQFEAWSGGLQNRDALLKLHKGTEFMDLIEDYCPDGIGKTELNDILWFDDGWYREILEISEIQWEGCI